MTAVDAHQHFWRLAAQKQAWRSAEHAGIAADYEPADLAGELIRADVAATVLVQSVDEPAENDRLRRYADTTSFVAGVVGWLPMFEPAAARIELDRVRGPHLRGVRCLAGRAPLDRLERPDAVSLLRALADEGLVWDIVPVTERQIRSVIRLADAVPTLRIVVDHLARPPVETGGLHPWADLIGQLAERDNVALKVSVGVDLMSVWPEWRPDDLTRYVDRALGCFGPERLMLASNWPVILLRRGYVDAWEDLTAAVVKAGATGADLQAVRGGSARHWYRL